MTALGIDVSRYQNPYALPWAEWVQGGLQVAVIQVTHGTGPEPCAQEHLAVASAAGVPHIGAYHYLTPGDVAQQVAAFLAELDTARVSADPLSANSSAGAAYSFAALDVEEAGVTAQDVIDFCQLFAASCPLPLLLYGNYSLLVGIVNAAPVLKKYPVWWAQYGGYSPPAGWDIAGHQYAGDDGRLPPYSGAIDLTTWYEIPGAPMTLQFPLVPRGSLVAIHAINPGDTLALVREAAAASAPYPAVKMLNDAAALTQVKQASPSTWTYLRYYNPDDDSLQGIDNWTTGQRAEWCQRVLTKIYSQITAEQCRYVDWACAWNEEDPPGPYGYKDLGETFLQLGQMNEARKAQGLTYVKLAFGCLAQGTPELWEMDQLIATGLFAWMRDHSYSWDDHEGWYPNQALEAGMGDALPSDPAHNYPGGGDVPAIPGSGSGNFRFVWMFEGKLRPLGQLVPLLIGEWYPAVPLGNLERYWWYDDRLSAYEYVTGFAGYNFGPTPDWPNLEPDYQSAAFKQHRIDIRDRRNGVVMPYTLSDVDFANLVLWNNQVATTLARYKAAPVYHVGDVVVATANPLVIYSAPNGLIYQTRANYSADMGVTAVSADGLWLQVFASPPMWVRVADVKLKA